MRKLSQEDFIKRCLAVHGGAYSYAQAVYVDAGSKVDVLCPRHGLFSQIARFHLRGGGCPKCWDERRRFSRIMPVAEFVAKASAKHANRYGYGLVSFTKVTERVKIVCGVHGVFEQEVRSHLYGHGCPACGILSRVDKLAGCGADFISAAKLVHGDRYDYGSVKYVHNRHKVDITCPEHGPWVQAPTAHLRGRGCPKCGVLTRARLHRGSTDEFISLAKGVHGDRYGYGAVVYQANDEKVEINCPRHGSFKQVPADHLDGHGCPACGCHQSKQQIAIYNALKAHFCDAVMDYKGWDVGSRRELDIFIPSQNFAVEFNGVRWHSSKFKPAEHLLEKQRAAAAVGIRVVHVFEDEWQDSPGIVMATLRHILGVPGERSFARKLTLGSTSARDLKVVRFLEENHLQGAASGGLAYTLSDGGVLNAVMVFSRFVSIRGSEADEGSWELRRYASAGQVVGGASKLLKAFLRDHDEVSKVVSYSDSRWFTGGMYERLGFKKDATLRPDYKYVSSGKVARHGKANFQRKMLAIRFGKNFNPLLTEKQNCELNGWYQLYDCGKVRWVLDVALSESMPLT